jgi:multidrug efflux pump subunit AcrB
VRWWFGFSINLLTMFAMVLAIGLLGDDESEATAPASSWNP